MERREPKERMNRRASPALTPAEALMLRLENIEPSRLEALGAQEERRLAAKATPWTGWRLDEASPVGGGLSTSPRESTDVAPSWPMPAASDDKGRRVPQGWATVYGDAMSSHGLRHGDRIRLDHDVEPSDGDIVLAEVQGVGRALRKLSIVGGVHILSGDVGVKPIVVDDLTLLVYHGVVSEKVAL